VDNNFDTQEAIKVEENTDKDNKPLSRRHINTLQGNITQQRTFISKTYSNEYKI
jgi:hypothetical protein